MKITIYWVTNDWTLIHRIREKYNLPQTMTVNGFTFADVDEDTLKQLQKGKPQYLIIRKVER